MHCATGASSAKLAFHALETVAAAPRLCDARVFAKQQFSRQYRQWARMTVVGRVTGMQRYEEPVLSLLYVRGWGLSAAQHGVWENVNPSYMPSTPGGIRRN